MLNIISHVELTDAKTNEADNWDLEQDSKGIIVGGARILEKFTKLHF